MEMPVILFRLALLLKFFFPAPFQLSRHEAIGRIDGIILALGELRLILGALHLLLPMAVDQVAIGLLFSQELFQGVELRRLQGFKESLDNRLIHQRGANGIARALDLGSAHQARTDIAWGVLVDRLQVMAAMGAHDQALQQPGYK